MTTFAKHLARLKSDLITQGERVIDMTLRAVESYFDVDEAKAAAVLASDDVIDRTDVEIERASIALLALGETAEHEIRSVLTIVKINNEFERIADCAVNIAEVVPECSERSHPVPDTFRVMANSVIGILRDTNQALARNDTSLAERVLALDDTVDRFKTQISLDAEEKVASGDFSVRFAFRLRTVTKSLERIADHCTNVCEQLIYLETGQIVRHLPGGWTKPHLPDV